MTTPSQQHICEIVESDALRRTKSPTVPDVLGTYLPSVVDSGVLSALQMSTVNQIFSAFRRNGAFLLGDGPGVGKTRMLAGAVALESVHPSVRGLAVLWVTPKATLSSEAKATMATVLGCKVNKFPSWLHEISLNDSSFKPPSPGSTVCCWSTYTMLRRRSLWEAFADFVEDNNLRVVIIFDEAHLVGSPRSQTFQSCMALQTRLSNACVLYSTATCAQNVEGLALMGERLGIWGPETKYPNRTNFIATIQKFAQSALQLLPIELKQQGLFVSRQLDQSHLQTETVVVSLTPEQSKLYDACILRWRDAGTIQEEIDDDTSDDDEGGQKQKNGVGGDKFRFFEHLLVSFKVDAAIETAKKAIEDGYSVVIAIQATGEASMRRRSKSMKTSPDGDAASAASYEIRGSIFTDLMAKYNVRCDDLPDLPQHDSIDRIIQGLGDGECVAELTGRKYRPLADGTSEPVPRMSSEIEAFQSNGKRVAIISSAGSTGIGLGGAKRLHIVLETPWSAPRFIQQCGRTHRAGTAIAAPPRFMLLVTDVPAERRHLNRLAQRMEVAKCIQGTPGDTAADTLLGDSGELKRTTMERLGFELAFRKLHACIGNVDLPTLSSSQFREIRRMYLGGYSGHYRTGNVASFNLLGTDTCSRRVRYRLIEALLYNLTIHKRGAFDLIEAAKHAAKRLLRLIRMLCPLATSWIHSHWSPQCHTDFSPRIQQMIELCHVAYNRSSGCLLNKLPEDLFLHVMRAIPERDLHYRKDVDQDTLIHRLLHGTPSQFMCDLLNMPVAAQRAVAMALDEHRHDEEDEIERLRSSNAAKAPPAYCALHSVEDLVYRTARRQGLGRDVRFLDVDYGLSFEQQSSGRVVLDVKVTAKQFSETLPVEAECFVQRGSQIYCVSKTEDNVSLMRPAHTEASFIFTSTEWNSTVQKLYLPVEGASLMRWTAAVRHINLRRQNTAAALSGTVLLQTRDFFDAIDRQYKRHTYRQHMDPKCSLEIDVLMLPDVIGLVVAAPEDEDEGQHGLG